jgi:2-octaprenyl-3-methyl-6-methoxy-1,4-benzoquinol hydroxylase/2-octaprenylphenol hydroxylase
MFDHDIVVVGAGMVGAATALAMARAGWRVALLEKQPLLAETPRGDDIDPRVSAISPASAGLLHTLGAWSMLDPTRINDIRRMRVWHEHGSSELDLKAEQVGAPRLGYMVENIHLQSALLKALRNQASVRLVTGVSLSAIEQNADSVSVVTDCGQRITAALLVAADGRGSAVRRMLNMGQHSGDYQQRAIVAHVRTERPHQSIAWQRFLSTGPLAFLPLWDGRSSIVWSADNPLADELESLADDAFRQQIERAFESRLGQVVETTARASFPLQWHSARRWLAGRALLIGDAAHGVHPLAGQGVNLGFGDVDALAQYLADSRQPYQYLALRRFERQRKAETATATQLFTALKHVFSIRDPWFCRARDIGMGLIDRRNAVKSGLISKALRNLA